MGGKGRVLVVGATGSLGERVARACLRFGHPTFLMVRPDAASNVRKAQLLMSLKRSGATFLQATLEDVGSLVDAMKRVDIVISCMGEDKLLEQLKLIEAAKQAGNIKRFLPSEFGMDPDRLVMCPLPTGDIFAVKRAVRRAVEESGIPYTYVCGNCLAGYFLAGLAQIGRFLPPTDQVVIYGDGNEKVVWNKEEDVASYVVKTVEDPRVVNTTIYVRPPQNICSLNEVVSIWEELSGKVLKKTHISEATWLNDMEGSTTYEHKFILGFFYIIFYLGWICNYNVDDNKEASHLYPEVDYTTVKSYLHDFV